VAAVTKHLAPGGQAACPPLPPPNPYLPLTLTPNPNPSPSPNAQP
jgi:hypothetical protein